MKKITFCAMAIFLSLAFYPVQSMAATTKMAAKSTLVVSKPEVSAQTKTLELRLDQIGKMDKSNLNSTEKRALRKEVRSIKEKLAADGGYIYVSVGAAILIVVLLIVLL